MDEDNAGLPPDENAPTTRRRPIADFLTGRLTISRSAYLVAILGLFVLKYALDCIIMQSYGQEWPLKNFFAPSYGYLPWDDIYMAKGRGMMLLTLPFFFGAALFLTFSRLRNSRRDEVLFVMLLLPFANLLFMAILSILKAPDPQKSPQASQHQHAKGLPMWICVIGSSSFGVFMGITGVMFFEDYGFILFLLVPFFQGFFAAMLRSSDPKADFGKSFSTALLSFVFTALVLLAINLDGLICILMAAPIALLLSTLGVGVFHMLFGKPELRPESTQHMAMGSLLIWTLVPAGMAGEHYIKPTPPVHAVVSDVIIAAAPQKIWDLVIAFPDLAPPDEPVFRTGVAYPLRARIDGHGVGAIRYCEFSTGPFVEPITTWDEPRRLAFGVTSQPPPMEELSLFYKEVHPPHLDNLTFKSHRGEFQLLPQADGRVLLRGTTWYSNNMFPSLYWKWWSDWIIHKIHLRVLNHIKELAEG